MSKCKPFVFNLRIPGKYFNDTNKIKQIKWLSVKIELKRHLYMLQ